MIQSASQSFAGAAEPEMTPLNVLVMYDDRPSGQRAKGLLDRAAEQIGIELELTMKLWRFDVLKLPAALEQAAVEAAAADVILLSLSRKTKMSSADYEWTTRWLDHKEDRPYLFCLMQGPDRGGRGAENPIITEMENFTGAVGAGFFCGTFDTPFAASDVIFDEIHERANQLSSVLEGILDQDLNLPGYPARRNGG